MGRGGLVVERQTLDLEVPGSNPTVAVSVSLHEQDTLSSPKYW